ncbi:unnamed protein product [Merluccius merluccius]
MMANDVSPQHRYTHPENGSVSGSVLTRPPPVLVPATGARPGPGPGPTPSAVYIISTTIGTSYRSTPPHHHPPFVCCCREAGCPRRS